MKESIGGAVNGTAPTLEIDVTVLPIPGDFDEDGDVDGFDLVDWEQHYGIDDGADADNDGDSDGADFLIWQRNYTGPGTLAATTVVPEPTSILLIATMLAFPMQSRLLRGMSQLRKYK